MEYSVSDITVCRLRREHTDLQRRPEFELHRSDAVTLAEI